MLAFSERLKSAQFGALTAKSLGAQRRERENEKTLHTVFNIMFSLALQI